MKQKVELFGGHTATVHLFFVGAVVVQSVRDERVDPNEIDFVDNDSNTRVVDDRLEFGDPLEQLIAAEGSTEDADSEEKDYSSEADDSSEDYAHFLGDYYSTKENQKDGEPHFRGGFPRRKGLNARLTKKAESKTFG